MAHISVNNLVIDFHMYQTNARSLRNSLFSVATGGIISKDNDTVSVKALNNINLEIKNGDRVGLFGHNGSGKTTLLRALSGNYEPVSGEVHVNGNMSILLDLEMGFDPQATGEENIVLRGIMMGVKKKTMKPLIEDIVAFSGLGEYIHLPLSTYSSGMLLRLAFAVSTALSADILIMDEWLSVGDVEFREKATERLTTIIEQSSIVVIASHDMEMLKKVCNRIVYLEHGKVKNEELLH